MPSTFCIAIVGAESTGKTTLASSLAAALAHSTWPPAAADAAVAPRAAWVPELLRDWCDAQGRTPRADEQAGIARAQHERIAAAAAAHDIVVCDTTALMTAVYSRLIFADRSLERAAVDLHRQSTTLTLLTALDLPWVGDGLQRDGPQVREPVDNLLRELMRAEGIAYAVVSGRGDARLAQALALVAAALHVAPPRRQPPSRAAERPRPFTRLADADADATSPRRWVCDCCVPEAEPALLALRQAAQAR